MKITITQTPLQDLILIDINYFTDERGFFIEPWHKKDFAQAGLHDEFVQEGHSRSVKHVLRGLHYQNMLAPMAKLVRCTVGSILDVAVDVRKSSKTFGKYFSVELSADNKKQLYVPVGFAHGFLTLSDVAEIQYKQTGFYTPEAEGTIAYNDPDIGIPWPEKQPILSKKDQHGMTLKEYSHDPAFL